ncbi:MAG: hypothetical protein ACXVCY_19305 [Pseudobdellovibrionaceae bacterium]
MKYLFGLFLFMGFVCVSKVNASDTCPNLTGVYSYVSYEIPSLKLYSYIQITQNACESIAFVFYQEQCQECGNPAKHWLSGGIPDSYNMSVDGYPYKKSESVGATLHRTATGYFKTYLTKIEKHRHWPNTQGFSTFYSLNEKGDLVITDGSRVVVRKKDILPNYPVYR